MPRSPILQQLVADLRRLLETSVRHGDPLPAERDLATMFGVSSNTVHRAITALVKDGLVQSKPRLGCIRTPSTTQELSKVGREGPLRIGLLCRRRPHQATRLYEPILAEARRRNMSVYEVPHQRKFSDTPARQRFNLQYVPWSMFDVGMLVEIEDTVTLSNPLLKRNRILAIDQDATRFGLDSVCFDDFFGGQIAARRLYELGHRRFAVSDELNDGWPWDAAKTARRHGFELELSRLGGNIRPAWRIEIPRGEPALNILALSEQIAGWKSAPPHQRPTAWFAFSSDCVADVIAELKGAGFRLPHDLSIISTTWLDDRTTIGEMTLTHLHMDLEALVRRAFDVAEQIARRPRETDHAAAQFKVLPALINGNSDAAPGSPGKAKR
jgi:DNA-binding LacI/PurR family transcriptional regulator